MRVRAVDTLELLRFDFNFEGNLIRGSGVAGVVWVPSGDWYNYELMRRTHQTTLLPIDFHEL